MWWISILLIILAGILNASMDVLKVRFKRSIFRKWKFQQWINPTIAWKNKWKKGNPKNGERFPFSSTIFVWITDMWHFVKMLMLLCISLSIVFYQPIFFWWIDWFIFYCSFTITFEIFFSKIFIK